MKVSITSRESEFRSRNQNGMVGAMGWSEWSEWSDNQRKKGKSSK